MGSYLLAPTVVLEGGAVNVGKRAIRRPLVAVEG